MRYVFFIAINPGRFRIWFSFFFWKIIHTLHYVSHNAMNVTNWYILTDKKLQWLDWGRIICTFFWQQWTHDQSFTIFEQIYQHFDFFLFFFSFHFRFFSMTVQNSIEINRKIAFKKNWRKTAHTNAQHTNAHAHASIYVRNT